MYENESSKNESIANITCSIVTYNSADDVSILLKSLSNQIPLFNVYVVDNASSDDTADLVRHEYPDVILIESKKNLGFGAGHNVAIRKVHSRYHIIVNPDIQIDDSTIQDLVEFMDDNRDIVCVTPKICNTDGTEQNLPKRYPKIKYFLGSRFEKKIPVAAMWRAEYTRSNENLKKVTDIDFCSGCFMFVRTETLVKVKGFDERYFLHFEDADLTRTLQMEGRTVYYPEVTVTHKWKRDNLKNKKIIRIALLSMIKYFLKWGY